jgi:hypothetical protein
MLLCGLTGTSRGRRGTRQRSYTQIDRATVPDELSGEILAWATGGWADQEEWLPGAIGGALVGLCFP